jgi:hypothetical protein
VVLEESPNAQNIRDFKEREISSLFLLSFLGMVQVILALDEMWIPNAYTI